MVFTKRKWVNTYVDIRDRVQCDNCNAWIGNGVLYYDATTGHTEWGNDSIDSIETHQLCSSECVLEFLNGYFKNLRAEYPSAYIDIESKVKGQE
jgi:hypothetical protein